MQTLVCYLFVLVEYSIRVYLDVIDTDYYSSGVFLIRSTFFCNCLLDGLAVNSFLPMSLLTNISSIQIFWWDFLYIKNVVPREATSVL